MEREHRYIVIKLKDVEAMGDMNAYRILHSIGQQVANFRASVGKPPLECVVVESDWPEYEPTWKAIADRMDGKTPQPDEGWNEYSDAERTAALTAALAQPRQDDRIADLQRRADFEAEGG